MLSTSDNPVTFQCLVEIALIMTLVMILCVFWLIIVFKTFNRDRTRRFQDAVDSMSQEEREEILKVLSEIDEGGRYRKKREIVEKKLQESRARRDHRNNSPSHPRNNVNLYTQVEIMDYRPSPSRSNDSYSDSSDSSSGSSSSAGSGSSSSD